MFSLLQIFPEFGPTWTWLGWIGMSTVLALTVGYAILILTYRYAWLSTPYFEFDDDEGEQTKISVIIPARNEAAGIRHCLKAVLDQQYPADRYEIIVVDDHSTDQTADEARRVGGKRIKVFDMATMLASEGVTGQAYKKKAIELAVGQATGDLIVTTDADTRPGSQWLKTLSAYYERHGSKLISGPVAIYPSSGFLGKWQELDMLSLVGIGGASIKLGFYNICNGANLAYEKAAFHQVNGFSGIDDQPSGDDMLLMHKIGKAYPGQIGFVKNAHAIVSTFAAESIGELWQQRTRWASKSTNYEDVRITLILIMVWFFNLSIPVTMALGAIDGIWFRIGLLAFLVKIVADVVYQAPVAVFFLKTRLLWSFLPMQVAHIAYVIAMGPWSTFAPYSWKGRKVEGAAVRGVQR